MVGRIVFAGAVAYAREVLEALIESGHPPVLVVTTRSGIPRWQRLDDLGIPTVIGWDGVAEAGPDLVVVAGWRWLVPSWVLALAPAVGFHSAKLPEYPGRAPVPWALVRGDTATANTLLYLDDGIDTGDVVDWRTIPILPGDTPDTLYAAMARTAADLIVTHVDGLLAGTAPRMAQDMTRRGPVTTADGWDAWYELERARAGHA